MEKIIALMSVINGVLISDEPVEVSSLRRALKITGEKFVVDSGGVTSFLHCRVFDGYIEGSVVYTSEDRYLCVIIERGVRIEQSQWPTLNGIAPLIRSSKASPRGYSVEYLDRALWYGASLNSGTDQLESVFSKVS